MAATLEIQLVTDILRLQADMKKAQGAIDGMTAGATAGFNRAGAAASKMAAATTGLGNQSKLASHQVTNLAYQFQDLGIQFAGAAASGRPLQGVFMALIQQGPQIAMIMNQAGIGAKGLAGEIGGMVSRFASAHPVLTAVVVSAGAAAAALSLFTATMNDARKKDIDAFKDSLGLTAKELKELGPVSITAGDVIKGLGMTIQEYLGVKSSDILKNLKTMFFDVFKAIWAYSMTSTAAIYAGFVGTFNAVKAVWGQLPAVLGDLTYSAANMAIEGLNWLIKKGTEYANKFIGLVNSVMANIPGMDGKKIDPLAAIQIASVGNPYAGAATKAGKDVAGAYSKAFGDAMSAQQGFFAKVGENSFKAMKDRVTKEAREKGLLDDDDAKNSGRKAGKKAGEEFGRGFLAALANSLADYNMDMAKAFGAKFFAAQDAEFQKFIDRVRNEVPNTAKPAQDGAEAYARWNDELRSTIDLLDQIGGMSSKFGDVLSALYGIRTGDFSGVPGAGGALLNGLFTTQGDDGKRVLNQLGEKFQSALDGVFGSNGSFMKVMQGAATGGAIGSIIGNGSSGAQFGGMAGGALGTKFGEKFLSSGLDKIAKGLGDFAGPLGSILGGVVGSVLGGLFKKTPTGSVILGAGGVVGTSGNGGRDASGLGTSVLQGLDNIAKMLGASATGNYAVSIGMRGDAYRVDTTGQGRTKESDVLNFGGDAQAAVKAAIRDAISDGAFEGLSEGVKKFLLAGDIEQQLAKYANFRSALDEYDKTKAPQNYELQGLATAEAAIKAVASEIGASAEEWAKIEELYAIKRKDITEKYAAEALEIQNNLSSKQVQILELEGKATEALDLARQIETSTMTAAEKALQLRIYALQDEAKAAAEAKTKADEAAAAAKKIADERYNLEGRLLELIGSSASLRQRELAAIDPANRAIQETIWQLEEMQKVAGQSRDLDKRLARATGNTALADAMDREDFLAQFGADLQAKALAVWNAEHKKVADTANKYSQMLADAAGRMGAANDNLAAANDNLASSMAETLDKFRGFSDGLRKFRDSVLTTDFSPERNFGGLSAQYNQTAMMARRGNEAALSGLPDIARQYLDAAKARSSTREDYERIVESVLRDTGAAIQASDAIADGNMAIVNELQGLRADMKAMGERQARAEEAAERNQRETREAIVDIRDGTVPIRTEAA